MRTVIQKYEPLLKGKEREMYNRAFLIKSRETYPFEEITSTIVVAPQELKDFLRGDFTYVPLFNVKEFHYLFELETDAEYFKSRYGKL